MDELCLSIANQNATILTGRSVGSVSLLAPATFPPQGPYAGKAKNQQYTRKRQDSVDDGGKSIQSNDSEETDKGREHESLRGSFTEELSAYIPKDSVLMRSIRDRKTQGLFFSERYSVGCKIQDLEGDLLQDLLADSNSSTGGALIVQDINQDWAEILRSEFPRAARTTFLAEHMLRLDESSVTEASMKQLGKEIGNVCPDARMKAKHFSDECLAVDFGFPFRLPKHEGLHIDILFDTIGLERVPLDYSFLEGTRQTVYEKDASNHWRQASHRISWCKLSDQFCKTECLSLDVFVYR
jgi:hypothetical protein